MGWGDWISAGATVIGTVGSLIGSNNAANRADDQLAQNQELVDLEVETAKRAFDISDEAAEDYRRALTTFYEQNGDAGFFNPGRIGELRDFYLNNRQGERGWVSEQLRPLYMMDEFGSGKVGNQTEDMFARLLGGPVDYDRFSTMASAGHRPQFNIAGNDKMIGDMINYHVGNNMQVADRVADKMFGAATAGSIRRGLGQSSFEVEALRSAGDFANEKYQEGIDAAIQRALQTLTGRSALATQEQEGRLRETQSNQMLAEFMAGLDRSQKADTLDFTRGIQSIIGGNRDLFWGGRDAAYRDLAARESLRPNDLTSAMEFAYSDFGNMNELRRGGLAELSEISTGPGRVRLGGFETGLAGLRGASTLAADTYGAANERAISSAQGLGTMLDSLSSVDWEGLFKQ